MSPTPTSCDAVRGRHGPPVPAVHRSVGPGRPVVPTGIEGVHRFLARVWALPSRTGPADAPATVPATAGRRQRELRRLTHRPISGGGDRLRGLHFNTAISKLMELSNAIVRRGTPAAGDDARRGDRHAAPAARAGGAAHQRGAVGATRAAYSIHQQPWPVADPALAAADLIELPVQVDGKLRDRLQVAPDTPGGDRAPGAGLRASPGLSRRPCPGRVVQIPGRLVNVVTPKG